jgi:hypothetical protein
MVRKNVEASNVDDKHLLTAMCLFEIGEQVLVRDEIVWRGRSEKLEA